MIQTNLENEVTLEIDALSQGRFGIGRDRGRVIMVAGTVPGDRVTARVTDWRSNYAIAELVGVTQPSPHRRQAPCPYVGTCGGCPWQQMDYAAQTAAKQRTVEEALRRIGKLRDLEVLPIVRSPREFHYRRRIRLRCDPEKKIGFSRSASHQLVEIDACAIAAEGANRALGPARRWLQEIRTPIREIEIVTGDEEEELVLVALAAGPFAASDDHLARQLVERGDGPRGIIVKGENWRHAWGEVSVTVQTEPAVRLALEADVFIQVNPAGNRLLLQRLLDAGDFGAADRVLELYCGAGNFTFSIARRAREVLAVEGYRLAVANARRCARQQGLTNIRWQAAPIPRATAQLARRRERFSKIVLDPPRAGAKGIERELAALDPHTVLYISCDPATLARDLAAWNRHGFRVASVQPFDLFPQTFHVETLAVLQRR